MAAGVFGYLGYDMVRLMEDLPPPGRDPIGIPDAILIRPTLVIAFDAVLDTITVVTPVRAHAGVTAKAALSRAIERLSAVVDALDKPLDKAATEFHDGPLHVEPRSNTSPDEFKGMVLRAKDYIAAGDIFQVVLSQRFEAPFMLPPFALYRALRRVNPSPYLYFLDFGGFRRRRIESRKFWSSRAAAPSPSARSPARGGAAPPRTKIRRSKPSYSPIPRNAPSI